MFGLAVERDVEGAQVHGPVASIAVASGSGFFRWRRPRRVSMGARFTLGLVVALGVSAGLVVADASAETVSVKAAAETLARASVHEPHLESFASDSSGERAEIVKALGIEEALNEEFRGGSGGEVVGRYELTGLTGAARSEVEAYGKSLAGMMTSGTSPHVAGELVDVAATALGVAGPGSEAAGIHVIPVASGGSPKVVAAYFIGGTLVEVYGGPLEYITSEPTSSSGEPVEKYAWVRAEQSNSVLEWVEGLPGTSGPVRVYYGDEAFGGSACGFARGNACPLPNPVDWLLVRKDGGRWIWGAVGFELVSPLRPTNMWRWGDPTTERQQSPQPNGNPYIHAEENCEGPGWPYDTGIVERWPPHVYASELLIGTQEENNCVPESYESGPEGRGKFYGETPSIVKPTPTDVMRESSQIPVAVVPGGSCPEGLTCPTTSLPGLPGSFNELAKKGSEAFPGGGEHGEAERWLEAHPLTGEPRRPDEEEQFETGLFGLNNEGEPGRHTCYLGKPVECVTGDEVQTQTDLAAGGRGPALDLALTYNSRLAAKESQAGPFGFGWTGSYSAHLELNDEGKEATAYQDNGSTVTFTRTGESWTAPSGLVQATLADEGSGYVYTLPDQTVLHFNSTGELTSEGDHNGNTLTMTYESKGHLESITDGASRKITLTYNGEGQVESSKDPMGHTVKYTYESGNLASVTLPGETKANWQYKYNTEHELTSETDGREHTTTTEYNEAHQVTAQTDPLSRKRTWKYATIGTGSETTITEPNGSTTIEQFNEYGSPTNITHASGTTYAATTAYEYNGADELIAVTDPDSAQDRIRLRQRQ